MQNTSASMAKRKPFASNSEPKSRRPSPLITAQIPMTSPACAGDAPRSMAQGTMWPMIMRPPVWMARAHIHTRRKFFVFIICRVVRLSVRTLDVTSCGTAAAAGYFRKALAGRAPARISAAMKSSVAETPMMSMSVAASPEPSRRVPNAREKAMIPQTRPRCCGYQRTLTAMGTILPMPMPNPATPP